MPQVFEKFGVSFQFPDNWTVDEEGVRTSRKAVTISSPSGGFWSLAVLPGTALADDLAEAAVKAMKEEYEELEAYNAKETIAGHELTGYDMNFACMDLIGTAQVRCLKLGEKNYTIFTQAEDREFERVKLVFQAMTTILLQSLKSFDYRN